MDSIDTLDQRLDNNLNCLEKEMLEKAVASDHAKTFETKLKNVQTDNDDLKSKITELQRKLKDSEREHSLSDTEYNFIYDERSTCYTKIKELEHEFLERVQTDQTIHLNKPKEF